MRLDKTVKEFIPQSYLYFGTGGALGFDALAAKAVLKARKTHPDIKLILVMPCATQDDSRSSRDRHVYEEIKTRADKVVYISQEHTKSCMFECNRHLVNNSSVCVCYLMENSGGTAYTVNYTKQKGF